ncbi:hypothetical protein HOY82DRAFT_538237 [Tuber indicum]|nr:hypothetical protein HOY82DRAFT_538237 [Tuber indicum]
MITFDTSFIIIKGIHYYYLFSIHGMMLSENQLATKLETKSEVVPQTKNGLHGIHSDFTRVTLLPLPSYNITINALSGQTLMLRLTDPKNNYVSLHQQLDIWSSFTSYTTYTAELKATKMDQSNATPSSPLLPEAAIPNNDAATPSATLTAGSSPPPLLLRIADAERANFIQFFNEQNITLPSDRSWPGLVAHMANFIAEQGDAEVLCTTTYTLPNGYMDVFIELSTVGACLRGFQMLSQSRAFAFCTVDCLDY